MSRLQNLAAEREFYDRLFSRNPENEHITAGYEELHDLAFPGEPDGYVLDIGCGTGAHAVRLARRGYDVVAVDLTLAGVQAARRRFEREALPGSFVIANGEALPFRDGAAAVTWTALLVHHFPEPQKLCSELARVTRDRLIAFEPNALNLLTWFAMNVVNRFWGIAAMTPNQVALRPGRLRRLFETRGFRQDAVHYVDHAWADRLGVLRRIYGALTRLLPERFRANKFLIFFERSSG